MRCNRCGCENNTQNNFCINCGMQMLNVNNNFNNSINNNFNNNFNSGINNNFNSGINNNFNSGINNNLVQNDLSNIYRIKKKFNWKLPVSLIFISIILFLSPLFLSIVFKKKIFILTLLQWIIPIIGMPLGFIWFIVELFKYLFYSKQEKNMYYNSLINSNLNLEQKMIMSYVGLSYFDIREKKFSFLTFFFSWFYLFVQKYYSLAIVSLILSVFGLIPVINMVYIIYKIVIAFNFKTLYLNYVTKKVQKILRNNSNLSEQELLGLCSK